MYKNQQLVAAGRIVTLALVLVALVMAPCFASDYVGSWKAKDADVTMVLKGDGTGKYVIGSESVAFKWKETDEGIELLNPSGGNSDTAHILDDGKTLRVVDGDNKKTTDFTKQ